MINFVLHKKKYYTKCVTPSAPQKKEEKKKTKEGDRSEKVRDPLFSSTFSLTFAAQVERPSAANPVDG